jgi:RNA polymerase sigma factor (sigma-70 family)
VDTVYLSDFLRRLTRAAGAASRQGEPDRQLVERFLAGGDEAAFEALVRRHGPMVYRVCWRLLQQAQDTEDAFQATFLVFAQKLRAVRKLDSVASWLHGVARRVALKARTQAATRRRHQREAAASVAVPPEEITWTELRTVLDAELGRLPEKWRLPLVLCYLEGRTQDEAAAQLGWGKNTLRRRLDEARAALGRRLSRRGVVWPGAFSAAVLSDSILSAAPVAPLIESATRAATRVAAGQAAAPDVISSRVAALTEGVLRTMIPTKYRIAAAVVFLITVLGIGVGAGLFGRQSRLPDTRPAPKGADPDEKKPAKPAKPDPAEEDRIVQGDRLQLAVSESLPSERVREVVVVEPSGKIALGPSYGRVYVGNMTLEEAEKAVAEHLRTRGVLRDPKVSLTRYAPLTGEDPERVSALERRVRQLENEVRALRAIVGEGGTKGNP